MAKFKMQNKKKQGTKVLHLLQCQYCTQNDSSLKHMFHYYQWTSSFKCW